MERGLMIAFVSGGARSGKSSFAERLALSWRDKFNSYAEASQLIYLATAVGTDSEMDSRIALHQLDRGDDWFTFEETFDLNRVFSLCEDTRLYPICLVDCLTVWLSHAIFTRELEEEEILNRMECFVNQAIKQELSLIIVSNDVNESIPSPYESVQMYIKILQRLHTYLASKADAVIQVNAGLLLVWKGGESL
jgi:adenosylcobinamide kinase/adenosylcobinamide-phosphate guanylyltransferase